MVRKSGQKRWSGPWLRRLAGMMLCWLFVVPVVLGQQGNPDPWERYNRVVYRFNKVFDGYVLRPVAMGYLRVMPPLARRGVTNFFSNLDDINVAANQLLQGKAQLALQDGGRLAINSTVGVVGLFDVASRWGLYKHNEDFGQTLGHWGVASGPYVVLPFLGTSTLRDTVGFVPDTLLNPIFRVEDEGTRQVLYVADTIDTRIGFLSAETLIRGDEYTFVRNAYLQRREYLVADGRIRDEFDDF